MAAKFTKMKNSRAKHAKLLDQINEISFELRMETIFNVNDLRSFATLLKQ